MVHRFHRAIVLLLIPASALFASGQTPGFKVIQPPGSDSAYSAGLLANGTLYVSGQGSTAFFAPPYPARSTLQQNFEVGVEGAEQISFIAVRRQPGRTDEASR